MMYSPLEMKSPSWTGMCLPFGTMYSIDSEPSSTGSMVIRRLFLKSLPKCTWPEISAMIAWSLGRRASKSSATRGRPPVMSLVLAPSRGMRAMTSPGLQRLAVLDREDRVDRHRVDLGVAVRRAEPARRSPGP